MNINVITNRLKIYQEEDSEHLLSMKFGVYNNSLRVYLSRHKTADIRDSTYLTSIPLTTMNARLIAGLLDTVLKKNEEYDEAVKLLGLKFDKDSNVVPDEKQHLGNIGVKCYKKDDKLINAIYIEDINNDKIYEFDLLPTPFVEIYVNKKLVTDKEILTYKWTEAYVANYRVLLDLSIESRVEKK